jgi:hypothetical protein
MAVCPFNRCAYILTGIGCWLPCAASGAIVFVGFIMPRVPCPEIMRSINYGTALSATQLGATSTVAGVLYPSEQPHLFIGMSL